VEKEPVVKVKSRRGLAGCAAWQEVTSGSISWPIGSTYAGENIALPILAHFPTKREQSQDSTHLSERK
jgi:hypothetical protein